METFPQQPATSDWVDRAARASGLTLTPDQRQIWIDVLSEHHRHAHQQGVDEASKRIAAPPAPTPRKRTPPKARKR